VVEKKKNSPERERTAAKPSSSPGGIGSRSKGGGTVERFARRGAKTDRLLVMAQRKNNPRPLVNRRPRLKAGYAYRTPFARHLEMV